jgi:CheY-like chemotaxis protein
LTDILIVDDNETNLKLLKYLLASNGYAIRTAEDAEQALAILVTYHPAAIMLDLQLPGMDGLSLARKLRANPAMRDIVIVAVTAHAMKGEEQRALAAGCDAFITKPIDTRTLPGRLAELLARGVASGGTR